MDGRLSRVASRQESRVQGTRRRVGAVVQAVVLLILTLAVVATLGTAAYAGWSLTHPGRKTVEDTPARVKANFDTVEFPSVGDSTVLRGWFLPAPASDKTIILAHGFAGNRLEKSVDALDLAHSLTGAGFNVLMFDFRNSGLSDGNRSTFGYKEMDDLLGAVRYLRASLPDKSKHIGVMGFSMGGVVALDAAAHEPNIEAVVADSPYADGETYLRHHVAAWSGLPSFLTPLIMQSFATIGRIQLNEVNPLQAMPSLTQHVFLIYGKGDEIIGPENSQMLAAAARPGLVKTWEVPGTTPSWPSGVFPADSPACYNVGARNVYKDDYDKRVTNFFRASLVKK